MPVTTKIRKRGNAAIIAIPTAILRMAELNFGDEVSLLIGDGQLVVAPVRRRRLSMSELLQGSDVTKKLTIETAWTRGGQAVGNEID